MCKRNGRTETITLVCGEKKWHFQASCFYRRIYAYNSSDIVISTEEWDNDILSYVGDTFTVYEAFIVNKNEHDFTSCSEIYRDLTLLSIEYEARATAQDPVQLKLTLSGEKNKL